MKELEDTKCEVRKTIDLQFSIWDRLNVSSEEDGGTPLAASTNNHCSNPLGKFFIDGTYAWISCGPRLVVVNVKTGTSIGSWTFSEKVTCVAEFPSQAGQIPLLLVGLDNEANKVRDSFGLICVFDCTSSQVLRAIRLPAGVEQACVIHGGAEWEDFGDKQLENIFNESNGVACVALRNLNHLMIDLKRSSWDGSEALPLIDEANPAEVDLSEQNETQSSRHRSIREKHAAYNIMSTRLEKYIGFNRQEFESSTIYPELLTSSLIASEKINCIISGCLGRIMIWQTNGEIRWISRPLDESMSVTHLALLEPTDDPRPFCYLWSAYQEETCRAPPILRMYAMLFERRYSDKGTNSYFNLESDPSVKFELELDDSDRITNLCPIIRDSNSEQTETAYKRGEDSLLLISMEARTVLFDLNQWYKEQMPHTIGECNNPNAIISTYRTRPNIQGIGDDSLLSCTYIPETLREFACNGLTPTEELFFPNSLTFEWIDLSTSQLTFWVTRGLQAELLREMSITGPVIMIEPTETFLRCIAAGLISTNGEYSTTSDKDTQREALLSLCLEHRWSKFLLRCAKEWSDGSVSYLFHTFLRWGMQRASAIKLNADRLSVPLYDQSGTGIGEAEIKQLRCYCQQLECITNVVSNLEIDCVDLTKEKRALRRVSTYLQVLLWFYDVGLLPETQEVEEEAALPISFSLRIPYPYERLAMMYREKRQEFGRESTKNVAESEEDMFIDELVTRECNPLKSQWEREGGEFSIGGYYPPSSLQSLLRSYLTDCCSNSDLIEMENKHQITIYLLMDLAMLLQNSYPGVNQLIKYPSAFKMSPSLIKLTQAFWLLDHEDYHGFLDMMTGQLVSDSDVKDWHHKLVMRTLIRNNQNKLALMYLRVRKPPLASLDEQSTVITLSVEHGLVQSAFHRRPPSHYAQLLMSFYRACKEHGKLNDILHLALDPEEEEAFVKFLENEKTEDTRLLYFLQRCRYAEASNVYPSISGHSSKPNYFKNNEKSAPFTIFHAYNATLPVITRKFSANIGGKDSSIDFNLRYPRPMSHCKSRGKTRDIHEVVARKARETYLRSDRSRVPFVSAPCISLKPPSENVGTGNTVFFVEKLKKTSSKRSLDEMRGDESPSLDNEDVRKRRRTLDSAEKNQNELSTGMVFDTPLVKRKNQITNWRSTPIETPHSILKIRQLIRESASSCHIDGQNESSEDKNYERERKPRQIRFSLGQQRMSSDSVADVASFTEKSKEGGDTVNEELESEQSSDKDKNLDEEENEEAYFSPEVSAKSFYEPTLLTDTTDISINISGPKPRPSLRRSNDSMLSLPSKSPKIPTESSTVSNELSFKSGSSTTNLSPSSLEKQEPLSETVYTISILDPDTSFERTLPTKWNVTTSFHENTFSFSEKSVEKCRDVSTLPACSTERSENLQKFVQTLARNSTKKSSIHEESTVDADEDKNSEVLMEVDGFGLDRESTNQSPMKNAWDVDSKLENMEAPTIQNITEITGMVDESAIVQKEEHEGNMDIAEEDDHEASVDIYSGLDSEDVDPEEKVVAEEEHEEEPFQASIEEPLQSSIEEVQQNIDYESELSETKDSLKEENVANAEFIDNDENRMSEKSSDSEPLNLRYEEEDVDEDVEKTEDDNKYQEDGKIEEMDSEDEEKIKQVEIGDEDEEERDEEDVVHEEERDDEENKNIGIELENESEEEDDEEDEVYQSLTNSMETVPCRSESSVRRSRSVSVDAETKNSSNPAINNVFNGVPNIPSNETNMTDDESSRSVDGSAMSVGSTQLDKTLPVESEEPAIINEASNMTNDDSTSSFDSSLFSVKKSVKNVPTVDSLDKEEKSTTEESSSNSSLFSRMRPRNYSKDAEPMTRRSDNEQTDETLSNVQSPQSSATENDISEITNDSLQEKDIDNSRASPRTRKEKQTPEKSEKTKISKNVISESEVLTPIRMTRSRRASSVVQEQSPMVESPVTRSVTAGRLRRATSLAKDFAGTENLIATPEAKENPRTPRVRRSVSLLKDSTPVKPQVIEEESSKMEEGSVPVGKRTRRGGSVQKELSASTKTKMTRSSSKISVSEDNVETEVSTNRKTRSKRTNSMSEDSESAVPKRMTRASSLVQEVPVKSEEVKATVTRGRTRGNSVPKETVMETSTKSTQRIKRGGSVINEVIHEEPSVSEKVTKRGRGSSREKGILEKASSSPAPGRRTRVASITSIPEEAEIEENDSDDEIFSFTGKVEVKNTRLRRAASVDSSTVSVKRRTRTASVRSVVIDEPIEEETEDALSAPKAKPTKKVPARRKRTASASNLTESVDETAVQSLPPRRTRKLSQKSIEGDTFQFSSPSRARDKPNDSDEKKDKSQVPDYIFSPPHTRSKHTSQPRRKVNRDFVPLTEEAKEAGKRAIQCFVVRPPINVSGQTRDPLLTYGPRKIFSVPKRSESLAGSSTGCSQQSQED